MTAYITTPEQHAQATDAIDNWIKQVVSGRGLAPAPAYEALAMLKAMKPVEHIAELMWDEEKQKPYMQYTMPIGLLPEGSKLYVKDQQC